MSTHVFFYFLRKLKFDAHVAKIFRKVSQQLAVLKRMRKMLQLETRMKFVLLI